MCENQEMRARPAGKDFREIKEIKDFRELRERKWGQCK